MAITVTTHWATGPYPWGWVRRYELRDSATGRLYSGEGLWPSAPTTEQIDARAAQIIAHIEWEQARPPEVTDRDRLTDIEREVLKGILQVNATSDHVASLTISAANKAGIQTRLAIVKNTLVDALTAMRQS